MKKYQVLFGLLFFTLSGCTAPTDDGLLESDLPLEALPVLVDNEDINELEESNWGSVSALANDSFTIESMLLYALQDELTARAEYEYIMDAFDVTKPFSNIMTSEETHIALLLPLFEAYDVDIIDDESMEHLFEISSLQEAYEIGVIAEINNIAMYELFLTHDLPDDLIDALTKLRDASENHLKAFEKNASKAT